MNELQPPHNLPEINSDWIVMRERELGKKHTSDFGFVSWNPNFILYADRLAINVKNFENLAQGMRFCWPLEITSLSVPKKDDEPRVDFNASPNGEAVITKISSKRKKPKPSTFYTDELRKKAFIGVNFKGIADYYEEKLADGKNNKKYWPLYGKAVNKAVRRQLPKMVLLNILNDKLLVTELAGTISTLLTTGALMSSLLLIDKIFNYHTIMTAHPPTTMIIMYEVFYMKGMSDMIEQNKMPDISEAVRKKIADRDFSHFFFPKAVITDLFIPPITYLTSRRPLIKGI